jgi:SAM-dependent methyltransferase
MNLIDIIHRQGNPVPYTEGEKIPWNDPGFSQRMLLEHLSQEHDSASRRLATIDKYVEWIHHFVLFDQPTKILDLGCGPGLYTSRLVKLGHDCKGIDFSPASITYAKEYAREQKLSCSYSLEDIRVADFGHGYGLVMLIFGEFNAFRCSEAKSILESAYQALSGNGYLLLEVHTFDAVNEIGAQPPSWYSADNGLFSDRPHICLTESSWDSNQNVATNRFYVIDGSTGETTRFAEVLQAYTTEEYQLLLEECGFNNIVFHPSLTGDKKEAHKSLTIIVCQKQNRK